MLQPIRSPRALPWAIKTKEPNIEHFNNIYPILINLPEYNFYEYEYPLAYQLILSPATNTEKNNQEISNNRKGCLFN